uniref:acrosin-like n=1 Tax=Podarcis muralis TaxID=64176 RepID=UPI00109F02BD|nr:acrosin-like [Podarcis muralis]
MAGGFWMMVTLSELMKTGCQSQPENEFPPEEPDKILKVSGSSSTHGTFLPLHHTASRRAEWTTGSEEALTTSSLSRVCGRRPLVPGHGGGTGRTTGGADALPGAWPWIVSLQLPTLTGHKHTCGGALITARWVLTAAHCFGSKKSLPHWRAVIGASKLSVLGSEVHVRYIKQVVVHEAYQATTQVNDVALMELDQPIICSDYIQPACMPDSTVSVAALSFCYISGWGLSKAKGESLAEAASLAHPGTRVDKGGVEASDMMQEAKVNRFSTQTCNSSSWYNGTVRENSLCAGYEQGGTDSCQGDSGSPLMCKEEASEPFWVIGVTSWGQGCGKAHRPGVYAATQPLYAWVKGWAGPMPQPPPTPEPAPSAPRKLKTPHVTIYFHPPTNPFHWSETSRKPTASSQPKPQEETTSTSTSQPTSETKPETPSQTHV